jgi:ABC-type uncharacterized transport system auxiliary subunit
MKRVAGAGALAAFVLAAGCVFRAPDQPRFFQPHSTMLAASDDDPPDPGPHAVAVRLRGVRALPFLGERIVWRVSDVEYGTYEQRRWFDLPAHYVDQALRTRLLATPGLRLSDDPHTPTIHVDVLAFDEMLGASHAAAVTLAATLDDPSRGRLLERTFDAHVPVGDRDPASVAKAMGEALDDAVAQVAEALRTRLHAPHARPSAR